MEKRLKMDAMDKLLNLLEYFINVDTGITSQQTEYLLERLKEVRAINDYADDVE